MTQGWKMPDGTPCGQENTRNNNRYCFDGECRHFDCNGLSKSSESFESCTSTSSESKTFFNSIWVNCLSLFIINALL